MFIAVLFTIAKLCNQPRYSSTDEQIKKTLYRYMTEYYSAMKKNEIRLFAMDGTDVPLLNKKSYAQKDKY
jgi:CO dehydrogenase/acetyl-CoA synthase alpha subunit